MPSAKGLKTDDTCKRAGRLNLSMKMTVPVCLVHWILHNLTFNTICY